MKNESLVASKWGTGSRGIEYKSHTTSEVSLCRPFFVRFPFDYDATARQRTGSTTVDFAAEGNLRYCVEGKSGPANILVDDWGKAPQPLDVGDTTCVCHSPGCMYVLSSLSARQSPGGCIVTSSQSWGHGANEERSDNMAATGGEQGGIDASTLLYTIRPSGRQCNDEKGPRRSCYPPNSFALTDRAGYCLNTVVYIHLVEAMWMVKHEWVSIFESVNGHVPQYAVCGFACIPQYCRNMITFS